MNIFLAITMVFLHVLLALLLCFIILLQKPDGSISVTNKTPSSRSENVVLNNSTIVLSIIFFTLSFCFNVYSEKQKESYKINSDNIF